MSTGTQVPTRPGSPHERQPPWQATLQQTLSAQNPDAQSSPVLQLAPFIFLPQLPALQVWVLTHSLDCAHVSKQAPVFGLHE
jgi:hypothetical protein